MYTTRYCFHVVSGNQTQLSRLARSVFVHAEPSPWPWFYKTVLSPQSCSTELPSKVLGSLSWTWQNCPSELGLPSLSGVQKQTSQESIAARASSLNPLSAEMAKLGLTPGAHVKVEEENLLRSCPLTSTHVLCTMRPLPPSHTNTMTINKHFKN